jgi:isopenicillin N synthase-like dioxygenase
MFYGPETTAKEKFVDEMQQACEDFGFFQTVNHSIPLDLQASIFQQSKEIFDLPVEVKEKYSLGKPSATYLIFNKGIHNSSAAETRNRRLRSRIRALTRSEFRKSSTR